MPLRHMSYFILHVSATPETCHDTFASQDVEKPAILVGSFTYRKCDHMRSYKEFQQVVFKIPMTCYKVSVFIIYE
jgi:hypothetical protein